MNRIIVDYLTFSVREPIQNSDGAILTLDFICELLRMKSCEFANLGKVKYYKERYECNGVSISVPFEERATKQGYNISMSGKGCRYFEQANKEGEMVDACDIWRGLFIRLRELTNSGISLNVSRIDIAIDDFDKRLRMEKIVAAIEDDEVATRFQRKAMYDGKQDVYIAQSAVRTSFLHRIKSTSVEFGSRMSRSFCRIYDKRAEQMQKNFAQKEEFERLKNIPHWVRLEIEFKDENAIKIVNAFIEHAFFPQFFAEYVNGMLRFIKRDDTNTTRCTTAQWWHDFIRTSKKATLACGDYKPVTRKRHLDYVHKMLYGVIYTAINLEGLDAFLGHIVAKAQFKLSYKHQKLCRGDEYNLQHDGAANADWQSLVPPSCNGAAGRDEYYYTRAVLA